MTKRAFRVGDRVRSILSWLRPNHTQLSEENGICRAAIWLVENGHEEAAREVFDALVTPAKEPTDG